MNCKFKTVMIFDIFKFPLPFADTYGHGSKIIPLIMTLICVKNFQIQDRFQSNVKREKKVIMPVPFTLKNT